jgi:hypothetical protein
MAVEFQRRAVRHGAAFEDSVARVASAIGYMVAGRRVRFGVIGEVDLWLRSPAGLEFFVECKGSYEGPRPGLMRTDTVKKAFADCDRLAVLADRGLLLLVTSHLPQGGEAAHILDRLCRMLPITVLQLSPTDELKTLILHGLADASTAMGMPRMVVTALRADEVLFTAGYGPEGLLALRWLTPLEYRSRLARQMAEITQGTAKRRGPWQPR